MTTSRDLDESDLRQAVPTQSNGFPLAVKVPKRVEDRTNTLVGRRVIDRLGFSSRAYQPVSTKESQMLGQSGLAEVNLFRKITDPKFVVEQEFQNAQPLGVRERRQKSSLLVEDVVITVHGWSLSFTDMVL